MKSGRAAVGHPVDVASGAVYFTRRDYTIPGRRDLVWERHYNTSLLGDQAGVFGPGWTTPFAASLTRAGNTFRLVTPRGGEVAFENANQVDEGGIVRDFGAFHEITKTAHHFVVTRWDIETATVERYYFSAGPQGQRLPLLSIQDATGQGIDLQYDSYGRLAAVRQRLEKRGFVLEYIAGNRIGSVLLRTSDNRTEPVVKYEYDAEGRLRSAVDAMGFAESYEYAADSRIIRETVKEGVNFQFVYDAQGRCARTTGPDGYDSKSLRYIDAARWTEVTNSHGNVTRYEWKNTGQIVRKLSANGALYRTEYDEFDRIVAQIGPTGATTAFQYDELGNRGGLTDALGNAYAMTFNEAHLLLTVTDPGGHVWSREYDAANRPIVVAEPLNRRWTFEYDEFGNFVRIQDPLGGILQQFYNANGDLLRTRDARGDETEYVVDGFGRDVQRMEPARGITHLAYDRMGRLIRVTAPDGATTGRTFDSAGNVASTTDGMGRTTSYRFGLCKQLLERIDPLGNVVRYTWDSEPKRVMAITNEQGAVYQFKRDEVGRVIEERGFDGRITRYEYDLADNCIARTNGRGERLSYEVDLLGRVVKQTAPDGTSATFAYDYSGNLISAVNPDCDVKLERDALGRVIKESQNEYAIETRYDSWDNAIGTRTTLGHEVTFSYDGDRLVGFVAGNHPPVTFEYDAHDNVIQQMWRGIVRLDQRFDSRSLLSEQVVSRSDPRNALRRRSYEYDKSDALIACHETAGGLVSYEYDPAERLLDAKRAAGVSEHFEYDTRGNLTRVQSDKDGDALLEYAPGDRLVRRSNTRYFYDDNGSLVRKVDAGASAKSHEWTFGWDVHDRLRTLTTPDGTVWHYAYDALGRRISKRSPTETVRFVWDRSVLIHQIQNGRLGGTWLYGPYSFAPLAQLAAGAMYCVISDQLGTPRELIDSAGAIVWTSKFRAWGQSQANGTSSRACPFRFQGQYEDAESGLHYNYRRYYDPQIGRFISSDPSRLRGGLNLYTYGRNPINYIDPFGLASIGQWLRAAVVAAFVVLAPKSPVTKVLTTPITENEKRKKRDEEQEIMNRANKEKDKAPGDPPDPDGDDEKKKKPEEDC